MSAVRRIAALAVKEMLSLLRDPKGRFLLIGPPLIQLLIFAFAATLEVRNVTLIVVDEDRGPHAAGLIHRLAAAPVVSDLRFARDLAESRRMLDAREGIAAVLIPPDLSREVERGGAARVQIALDGRRSNAAQIVAGYVSRIVQALNADLRGGDGPPVEIAARNWFNPNLLYLWFTVPSLVAILALQSTGVVTALSVARERELGTFEQLLVSPLRPHEILLGKTLPALGVGVLDGLLILVAAVTLFQVPFTGSLTLLLGALTAFVLSIVGVGLFISALASTQQQAILGTFVFLAPAVTLSGYASAVENMPDWLQTASLINPLRHFLVTVKGLFLKDMSAAEVWANTWPLLVIAAATLPAAGRLFTRRLR